MKNSAAIISKDAQDCLQHLESLHTILEKEQALLQANKLEQLDAITGEKSQLLTQIEQLKTQVLAPQAQDINALIKDKILALAKKCKLLNESNNAIIQIQQQFIQQKIQVLFGYEKEPSVSYADAVMSQPRPQSLSTANNIIGKA
ncbi:MAG: flagellar protein FlgN [Pseudomonadales bacterium]|nr:flagellar protein FlgN [Pseudomonadales bacterium]